MLRRTILLAAGVVLLLVGAVSASGRATAGSLIGTWSVKPGPFTQAPWHDGGRTITIRSSSQSQALPVMKGSSAFGDPMFFFCGSTPQDPDKYPGASWFALTYDWQGGGTLMGCSTNPAEGASFAAGSRYVSIAFRGSDLHANWWPVWGDNSSELPFDATQAAEGTTKTVSEPKPGGTRDIESPPLPTGELCGGSPGRMLSSAKWLCGIGIRSSGGDLKGTTILTEGEVTGSFGNAVASCWLTFDFRDSDGDVADLGPKEQLEACVEMVRDVFLKHKQGPAAKPVVARAWQSHEGTTSAAAGCKTKRIAIAVKLRKGRVISVRRAKNQKLRASSVRYRCATSGGEATLTVVSSRPLSKVVGKRLNMRVVPLDEGSQAELEAELHLRL